MDCRRVLESHRNDKRNRTSQSRGLDHSADHPVKRIGWGEGWFFRVLRGISIIPFFIAVVAPSAASAWLLILTGITLYMIFCPIWGESTPKCQVSGESSTWQRHSEWNNLCLVMRVFTIILLIVAFPLSLFGQGWPLIILAWALMYAFKPRY